MSDDVPDPSDIIDIGDGGFEFTTDMDYRAQMASIGAAGVSLLLCTFICLAALWIYRTPSAKQYLNRVSFRIFLWSMAVEVVYDIVYIYIFLDPLAPTANPIGCGAAAYFLVATMGTSNWLCTCIGLNLALAICMGVNTLERHLERYYIIGSFIMGFGVTLVPAALGHFGVDDVYGACYFTETDGERRIRDFIVDLYLWQILSCFIAAASVLATLVTLFRQSRDTERALFRANSLNITSAELAAITSTSGHTVCSSTPSSCPSRLSRFLSSLTRYPSKAGKSVSKLHRLEDKFVSIALKISLYPLVLIIINAFITAEDLVYTVKGGVRNQTDYVFYVIYYVLYGGRGICFALLGILVDPCLRKGLPAAYRATLARKRSILPVTAKQEIPQLSFTCANHWEKAPGVEPTPVQFVADGSGKEEDAGDQSLADFLSADPGPDESHVSDVSAQRGQGSWASRSRQDSIRQSIGAVFSLGRSRQKSGAGVDEWGVSGRAQQMDHRAYEGSNGGKKLELPSPVDEGVKAEPEVLEVDRLGGDLEVTLEAISVSWVPGRRVFTPPHLDVLISRPTARNTISPVGQELGNLAVPITSDGPPPAPAPSSRMISTSQLPSTIPFRDIPLPAAFLPPPLGMPRRTSDPAIGASYRRKRALQIAAEAMFRDAEARL